MGKAGVTHNTGVPHPHEDLAIFQFWNRGGLEPKGLVGDGTAIGPFDQNDSAVLTGQLGHPSSIARQSEEMGIRFEAGIETTRCANRNT